MDTGQTQNVGYDYEQVAPVLARLSAESHSHEVIDGTALPEEQREKFISDTRMAFVFPSKKGRKIGNAFGTNKYRWQDFGTDIPVLLVYEDGQCVDAYPHHEGDRLVTIMEYLTT